MIYTDPLSAPFEVPLMAAKSLKRIQFGILYWRWHRESPVVV